MLTFWGECDEIQSNLKSSLMHVHKVWWIVHLLPFFFSIKSIFEVYNEGTRETILMQQWRSNEKQKKNSKELIIVPGYRTATVTGVTLHQKSFFGTSAIAGQS